MNPFLFNVAYKMAKRRALKKATSNINNDNKQKEIKIIEISIKSVLKNLLFVSFGIFAYAFGLKGFLLPNQFVDGGATGISLLLSIKTGWSLALLIIIIHIPFFLLGFSQINKWLVFKSIIAVLGLALVVFIIDFPIITNDKLLVAVFGGFFLGIGSGFAIRGGAVIDGTELFAIYTGKKFGFTIGDMIALINVIIFLFAAYYLSIEQALYSILAYLAASKAADFIIQGVDEYTGVYIISELSDEIRLMITNQMGRGVTILSGKRGLTNEAGNNESIDVIYTVITRLEISKLNTEIAKIDQNAFITMNTINDIRGGMVKKRKI